MAKKKPEDKPEYELDCCLIRFITEMDAASCILQNTKNWLASGVCKDDAEEKIITKLKNDVESVLKRITKLADSAHKKHKKEYPDS